LSRRGRSSGSRPGTVGSQPARRRRRAGRTPVRGSSFLPHSID
jgi:hypothetical protein